MTTFQKWLIAIAVIFGLTLLYFWRSDIEYAREHESGGGFGGVRLKSPF